MLRSKTKPKKKNSLKEEQSDKSCVNLFFLARQLEKCDVLVCLGCPHRYLKSAKSQFRFSFNRDSWPSLQLHYDHSKFCSRPAKRYLSSGFIGNRAVFFRRFAVCVVDFRSMVQLFLFRRCVVWVFGLTFPFSSVLRLFLWFFSLQSLRFIVFSWVSILSSNFVFQFGLPVGIASVFSDLLLQVRFDFLWIRLTSCCLPIQ